MVLEQIVRHTAKLREQRRRQRPAALLAAEAKRRRDFRSIVQRFSRGFGVVAEVKKASPSEGLLVPRYCPALIASRYEDGGACAVSVLTCPPFFLGKLEHLRQVREAVSLPVLRKDFLTDPYDILESCAAGADAVLLIVRLLDDAALASLSSLSRACGMETVIEVHDEKDLQRALAVCDRKTTVIGINNRDLATLKTDVATTYRLLRHIPADIINHVPVISESGLCPDDVGRLIQAGARGILVGTSLLKANNHADAVRTFLSGRRVYGAKSPAV